MTKQPDFDEMELAANMEMNAQRATKKLSDKAAHEAYLARKKFLRNELAAAQRRFDAKILEIDGLRKEAAKAAPIESEAK